MAQELTFDVVVLGGGAVGENAADRASRTGLSVAIVEHGLVGGECSYYACMPSKALLRPGAALAAARAVPGVDITGGIRADDVFARRDAVASHWSDASQVRWLERVGLTLVRGHARFTGPRELAVTAPGQDDVVVRARHAVIVATGSAPALPPVPGLADVGPWTSRDATAAHEAPGRLVVLGGGVVGVELATAYADLGSDVTLVVRGSRVLAGAEPLASDEVARALVGLGVRVLFDAEARSARRDGDGIHIELASQQLVADRVLVATGRRPATAGLGLEVLGLAAGRPLVVDASLQVVGVSDGWLFAAGDVTGRTATTHQGKYDARVVGDVVAARFGSDDDARAAEAAARPWSRYRASADDAAVPQVVFTRPEVAWVGRTEAAAQAAGLRVRTLDYDLENVAGATVTSPDYRGRARLVVDDDRGVVVGATFVGPEVADLLHAATIAVVGEVPLDRLWHAVPAYPTLSEVWLRFLEAAGL